MKFGLVLSTKDAETAWNALRLGLAARDAGHEVRLFLLGAGVELEGIDDARFDVQGRLAAFAAAGGEVMACGTCLDVRGKEGSAVCPVSTMADLLALAEESDRLLTFG